MGCSIHVHQRYERQSTVNEYKDSQEIRITHVGIRLLDKPERGVVAWAACTVNDMLFFDSIAVQKSHHGKIILSFPCRESRTKQKYHYFKPISHRGMRMFEEAIIEEYRIAESYRMQCNQKRRTS